MTTLHFLCISSLLDKTATNKVVFVLAHGTEDDHHKGSRANFVILVLGTKYQHKNYILYPSHNIFIYFLVEMVQISET